ncbi:MAG TPA: PqqD family protein [Pedococcus sp.]|nr:PqqD family protein [Pedococcus sp.]
MISETIDGETIILHLGNGFYFSAGGAGAQAWSLLSQAVPVQATAAVLSRHYDTDGVDVEAAVADFVDQLNMEGLLVPADGAAVPEVVAPEARLAWQPPSLSKFTDMEDLLLLDPVHEVSPSQGWPYAASSNGGPA